MHEPPWIPYPEIMDDWWDERIGFRPVELPPIFVFYVSGYGSGYGYGYGYGYQLLEGTMPIVGKRMLIFCGLSFAFVADVAEQRGPYHFILDNCFMLCRTGGIPWDRLADGHDRAKAIYRWHGSGVSVGPFFSWSREWSGELPPR